MRSAPALIQAKTVTIAIRNETRQRERAQTVLGRRSSDPCSRQLTRGMRTPPDPPLCLSCCHDRRLVPARDHRTRQEPYAPLLAELPGMQRVVKDLEVYRDSAPPEDYSITIEIDGFDRAADEAGFDRFHLYGHSGGGAIALAYVAARPHRMLSLAVDARPWTSRTRATGPTGGTGSTTR